MARGFKTWAPIFALSRFAPLLFILCIRESVRDFILAQGLEDKTLKSKVR